MSEQKIIMGGKRKPLAFTTVNENHAKATPADAAWIKNTAVTTFNSLGHFREYCNELKKAAPDAYYLSRTFSPLSSEVTRSGLATSWSECNLRAKHGNDKLAPLIDAVISNVEAGNLQSTAANAWQTDVVGVLPHVPNAIIGAPDSMLAPSATARGFANPVRIFVDVGSSSGLSPRSVALRGAAVAALATILARTRTVELYAIDGEGPMPGRGPHSDSPGVGATWVAIRIGESPLSPAHLAFVLCDRSFERRMCHGHATDNVGAGICWSWGLMPNNAEYRRRLDITLNASTDDLVIPGAHLSDVTIKDPVGWVRRELAIRERVNDGSDDYSHNTDACPSASDTAELNAAIQRAAGLVQWANA